MNRPYRGKALWSTVEHGYETPDPQQDSSPRRCQKRTEHALAKYKASSESTKQFTRHTRHRRQSHRCLDEPEYRGNALWSTVGHGCETPDPQQDSSPRRCQERVQRCKAIQGIQGIEGNAIDVPMDRPVPWKRRVEHCGA